jgi:dihydrodipicolinate synthase/N-acetylneuraminate lyase
MAGARFRSGSGVPLVTPFRAGAIDFDALGGLIEFQIDAETDAIVICGSTGENQALSVDERGQLIDCAIRTARGRIAVIAATGAIRCGESALSPIFQTQDIRRSRAPSPR